MSRVNQICLKSAIEWVQGECEIPAAEIRRIGRELAAAAPAAIVYPGRRTSDYVNSTQIRRSMAIINALLGNWDQTGGLLAARKVGISGPELPDSPFYEDNPDDRADHGRAHMMFDLDSQRTGQTFGAG